MDKFRTQDINLTAYLITKGYKVVSTELNEKIIEFYFESSALEINSVWQFNPTSEIVFLQEFLKNKEKILNFIKEKTTYRS